MLKLNAVHELENIHQSALELLEEAGVFIDHPEAERLFEKHHVQIKDRRAYLPKTLVTDALQAVAERSGRFQIYDRNGQPAFMLENGATFFGPGSDALEQIDLETNYIVSTTLRHIADNVRLADALDAYSFVMSMGVPPASLDTIPAKVYPEIFAIMVQNTTKPIVATLTTRSDLELIHKIAAIAVGSEKELERRPFFLAYLEPLSPLIIDYEGAGRILYCAEHEIPMIFASGSNLGVAAPINPEWGVLQGHAESLSGMVLAYLKNPNVKFVYGANTSSMDMRTMKVGYGTPEWAKTVTMYAMLGEVLGLPTWGTAGCSDSFKLDGQAGSEAMESIVLALLSKSTLVHDMGYLSYGRLNNPAMHVFANFLVQRAKKTLWPPDLSLENLAKGKQVIVDVINGSSRFFDHETTLISYKEALWIPPEFWERRDIAYFPGRNFEEEWAKLARDIIKSHQPVPLSLNQVEQINTLLISI